jgi:rhamnulose-1-phosphate aldolase
MALNPPYPELDEILDAIGEAGARLSDINASEGAAGNISVYLGWPVEVRRRFPLAETIDLPTPAPALVGSTLIVTGSGRRLREIESNPLANLGVVVVNGDGQTAQLYTAPGRAFARLTSEFNSHLAVHNDQVSRGGGNFRAAIHAQPLHITYLSQIPRYQDELYLNRHVLRWEPELIIILPEGIAPLPFMLPGSAALMDANVLALQNHKIALWGKHGVMAHSDTSVKRACDFIEYVETGAHYEYLNLVNGEQGEGLTPEELRAIAAAFKVEQAIF